MGEDRYRSEHVVLWWVVVADGYEFDLIRNCLVYNFKLSQIHSGVGLAGRPDQATQIACYNQQSP